MFMESHGLDACHCFAYRRSARHIGRLYDRHLAAAQIKSSQFSLLIAIGQNAGIQVSQLADLMVMERTTLVRALKPLQEVGWVESQPTPGSRALALSLTGAGRRKASQCEPLWTAAQQEFEQSQGKANAAAIRKSNLAVSASAQDA
jgi:DNA-binding MarR family transcriptional regulator